MTKIYVQNFCDDDLGEADAFYEIVDGHLTMITAWSNNDASYRSEYMSPLFLHLGVDIQRLPKEYQRKAKDLLAEAWGIEL